MYKIADTIKEMIKIRSVFLVLNEKLPAECEMLSNPMNAHGDIEMIAMTRPNRFSSEAKLMSLSETPFCLMSVNSDTKMIAAVKMDTSPKVMPVLTRFG